MYEKTPYHKGIYEVQKVVSIIQESIMCEKSPYDKDIYEFFFSSQ